MEGLGVCRWVYEWVRRKEEIREKKVKKFGVAILELSLSVLYLHVLKTI